MFLRNEPIAFGHIHIPEQDCDSEYLRTRNRFVGGSEFPLAAPKAVCGGFGRTLEAFHAPRLRTVACRLCKGRDDHFPNQVSDEKSAISTGITTAEVSQLRSFLVDQVI